jgi:hypothetical protein
MVRLGGVFLDRESLSRHRFGVGRLLQVRGRGADTLPPSGRATWSAAASAATPEKTEEDTMDTEQKGREAKRSGNSTEPTVAGDSMQSKPPGVQQAGSANVQSATAEEEGGALRDRGNLQTGSARPGDDDGGSARGGAGAQKSGFSARQQGERNEARAEEDRAGEPQQSGYGGLEQKQRAGSEESPVGPPGSRQTGGAANVQQASQARSDAGSKQPRYDDSIEGKQARYDSARNRGGD